MRVSFRTKLLASYAALVLVVLLAVDVLHVHPLGASLLGFGLALVFGVAVARLAAAPLVAITEASDDRVAVLRNQVAAITAERDRLSSMLDGMVEGVMIVSPELRVVLANRAANLILDAASLAGRTVAEAIRQPAARTAIEEAVRDQHGAELELSPVGARGRAILFGVRPLEPSAGGGAVVVLHDVTALRRLELVRRDFVANVSHELRTPVASIQSYAETLADGALGDPATARKFVEVIHRNAARLGRLVGDLLTLSRLEARAPDQVARVRVVVGETARRVVDTVHERAGAAGMQLTAEVPAELAAIGDPDGIEQMLLNLVDNAVKYGKSGGAIAIRGREVGGAVEIVVADDGPGIESRHLPRIFERFYRVDEGRGSDGAGGTGLGLAIVKHLAEAMGGSIDVQSQVGAGTQFTIRLPSAAA